MSLPDNRATERSEQETKLLLAKANMGDRDVLLWIKKNLAPIIQQAIADSGVDMYSESLLAGMALREAGIIIAKYAAVMDVHQIASIARGDFSKRPKDKEKIFHGYSFWQIDIDSFPDFIRSGDWKSPYLACRKAISVLQGKRRYIHNTCPNLSDAALYRATIAAYNFGEGNAVKRIRAGVNIDQGTAHNNYSASVLKYKEMYEFL